jgi:glycosyltransferase involved in cell wall biosynthesis
MRVGIYLGDFSPDVGGGYTFQDDVFRAFVKVALGSGHQFVVMGTSEHLSEYVGSIRDGADCKIVQVSPSIFAEKVEALKNYSPLLRKFLPKGAIERVANQEGLDFLWYVGGGAYEATDTPYVATVWDIQHRLTPWFPEMSVNGTWDAREMSYRRFLQRASYIITGTEVGKSELKLCYEVGENRIKVLPHPTPAFTSKNAEPTGIQARLSLSEPYLLYPAQFWPHKNHANLLQAIAILRDEHRLTLPLVFAGSEKGNIAYAKKIVRDLDLRDQVHFAGFVSQAELVDLYRGALALVYASFCGPENLPPLEAFSLGCPVLAADVPGSAEQLRDAALFFDPANPADLAKKILDLAVNEALRSDLVARGTARAKAWTAQDYCVGVLNVLDEFSAIRQCWPRS